MTGVGDEPRVYNRIFEIQGFPPARFLAVTPAS